MRHGQSAVVGCEKVRLVGLSHNAPLARIRTRAIIHSYCRRANNPIGATSMLELHALELAAY